MKPLLEFADRHPVATTVVGTTSGAASWVLDHTAQITGIAGMIGATCTALIAVLALAAKLWQLAAAAAQRIRRARRNREQCRRHFRDAPFDELP